MGRGTSTAAGEKERPTTLTRHVDEVSLAAKSRVTVFRSRAILLHGSRPLFGGRLPPFAIGASSFLFTFLALPWGCVCLVAPPS